MTFRDCTKSFISRCVEEQSAFDHLKYLCEDVGQRLAGSEGERKAVDHTVSLFRDCGLEAEVLPFSYNGWKPGRSRVRAETKGGSWDVPSLPLGWCPGTDVSGPVVDAGFGTEKCFESAEVAGKIVLVSSALPAGDKALHRTEKYTYAVKAGASGYVQYHNKPGGLIPMGTVNVKAELGPIPAVGISYEEAMKIRRNADGLSVDISSSSGSEPVTSANGVGFMRGKTEEEIVVCAHIDTWFSPGACDNASGSAMVMELARLLSAYKLDRTVRFIVFGSEELGLLGSKKYVNAREDFSHTVMVVNLDIAASRGGSPSIRTNGNPVLAEFYSELGRSLHMDLPVSEGESKHSDHYPFKLKGVPAAFLASGGSFHNFNHTAYDTLDKVAPESFTLPLLVAGTAVLECAGSDVRFRE